MCVCSALSKICVWRVFVTKPGHRYSATTLLLPIQAQGVLGDAVHGLVFVGVRAQQISRGAPPRAPAIRSWHDLKPHEQ